MSSSLELLKNKIRVKIRLAQVKAARELAALIPELIRLRTRGAGEGVNGPLKELSDSYIKQRKGELAFKTIKTPNGNKVIPYVPKEKPVLHPETTPEQSNLTATGQLLDSIKGKNFGSKILIEPTRGKRQGELSGADSTLTNRQVLRYVEENGREFLELSESEREEIIKIAQDIIKEEIKDVIK